MKKMWLVGILFLTQFAYATTSSNIALADIGAINNYIMQLRYVVLSFISLSVSLAGWLILIGAPIGVMAMIIKTTREKQSSGNASSQAYIYLKVSIVGMLSFVIFNYIFALIFYKYFGLGNTFGATVKIVLGI